MYELGTGQHPIASDPLTPDEYLERLTQRSIQPPSHLAPELSPFFDELVMELLARDPQQRPSAAAVAERLATWRGR